MTARAVTITLLTESPALDMPALPSVFRGTGLLAMLRALLPNGATVLWNAIGGNNRATAGHVRRRESERSEAPACDVTELAAADAVDEEDWADVRASLRGDDQAYARLVGRYQQAISAYLWRFTRDHNELEELTQEVFVEAYLGLAKFAGRAPLLHWLKRIATRAGYRHWKNRRLRREFGFPVDIDALLADADDADASRQAAEVVHMLLAELKPRDRLVLTLAYLEECNAEEIARLTGWSETMVRVQSHRARKRFAKICEQKGIEL